MSTTSSESQTLTKTTTTTAKKAKKPSMWGSIVQGGFAEFLSVVLFGVIAAHARVFSSNPGPEIGGFLHGAIQGAGYALAWLPFSPYLAGYVSLHALATVWPFGWNAGKGRNAWYSSSVVIPFGVRIAVMFGAWIVVAAIGWATFSGSAFDETLAFPLPTASDFTVFLLEFLGKLLIDLTIVFTIKHNSAWSAVAIGLAYFVAVAALGPITGGSLNAVKSLTLTWVNGADFSPAGNTLVHLAYFGSELAAPLVANLIKVIFFCNNKVTPRDAEKSN